MGQISQKHWITKLMNNEICDSSENCDFVKAIIESELQEPHFAGFSRPAETF